MPPAVSRLGRALDLLGLLLLIAGAGFYLHAYSGFEALRSAQPEFNPVLWAALSEADGYTWMSRIGIALVACALGTFVAAFAVARRARPAQGGS